MKFLKDILEPLVIFTKLQRNFQKKFEPLCPHGFLAILMYVCYVCTDSEALYGLNP